MKYPFNMGVLGFYANSKAKSPFRIGKTLSQPPAQWTVSNELRAKLFATVSPWFQEWERKHKVGLDPKTGEEVWEVRPHHFIRCSRCKQKDGSQMHLVEPPGSGVFGPYCTLCLDLVLAKQFSSEDGSHLDLTVYTFNTREKDLTGYIEAFKKGTAEPEPPAEDIDTENLF